MGVRRHSLPQPIEPKEFTVQEVDIGIRKLKRRIDEVQGFSSGELRFDDARVRTAENNIRDTVREVFGPNSPEFHDHQYHHIWHGGYNSNDEEYECQEKFLAGVTQTTLMLQGLIARLEEKRKDIADVSVAIQSVTKPGTATNTRRVFVVHGRDEEAKQSVARFLERLQLEPIILCERPNEGRTIIEKFESNADVSFAVVLLTPDDMGSPRELPAEQRPRARQNVILELGYFVGRLSRARVCALYKGATELPSDMHGVMYITMDEADGWRLQLARELKQAGLDIDLNLAV
jgi:predicted nucleotide-binding protein